MDYTDVEKERILLKMKWEGGLIGYMGYGLPSKLYDLFKTDLDEVYEIIEPTGKKKKTTKKERIEMNNKIQLTNEKILGFLKERNLYDVKYTDDELNAVNDVLRVEFKNIP
jgi:hypothetical protein